MIVAVHQSMGGCHYTGPVDTTLPRRSRRNPLLQPPFQVQQVHQFVRWSSG